MTLAREARLAGAGLRAGSLPLVSSLAAILVGACADRSGSSGPEPADAVVRIAEDGDVRLKLVVGRSRYGPGDRIEALAEVENVGTEAVMYWMPTLQGPTVDLVVETPVAGARELRGADDPRFTNDAGRVDTLDAGAHILRRVAWNGELEEGVAAPPGTYTVTARFHRLPPGAVPFESKPLPLTVTAAFGIEGTPPIIAPITALQLAVNEPGVRAWYHANGSRLVCESIAGRIALVDGASGSPGAVSLSVEPYVTCALHLERGPLWRIVLGSVSGEMPAQFTVVVDAVTGRVLRVSRGAR